MVHQSHIDKWFIRGKDMIIIVGAVATFIAYGLKFYALPQEVEAQGKEIKIQEAKITQLHETDLLIQSHIEKIDLNQDYTNKGVDRIENLLKSSSQRIH